MSSGFRVQGLGFGFRVVQEFIGWGAVPLDVWGTPRRALSVHSPEAPPIVLLSIGVKADVYLPCLSTLVLGGKGGSFVLGLDLRDPV